MKYNVIHDRQLLIDLYINQKKSVLEISSILQCPKHPIYKALIKYNIPRRNNKDIYQTKHHRLKIDDNVLCGSLLGDGHLKYVGANTKFIKGNKGLDHVEYVAGKIYPIDYKNFIRHVITKKNSKTYSSYIFRTYAETDFNAYHIKWYPKSNNFKKIIPKDLILTPEIVHHWFLDDGCAPYTKYKHKWYVDIRFSSESFTKEENEFLAKQLNDLADLDAKLYHVTTGSGWRVWINASHVQNFYKLIGPPIIPSLAYKWKEHLSDRVDPRDTLQYKHVDLLQ